MEDGPHQLSRWRALDAHYMALPLLTQEQDAGLHEKEFLKSRPPPGFLLLLPAHGIVHGLCRIQPSHEMLGCQGFLRQVFHQVLHMVQSERNHISHLLDPDALGQRINGHQFLECQEFFRRYEFDFRIR